jgi:hypothetical protein
MPEGLPASGPLRSAVETHSAWIAIDMLRPVRPGTADEFEQLGQRLAAAFCDEHALAIYAMSPRKNWQRLIPADAVAREQLASGNFLERSDAGDRNDIYLDETAAGEGDASPSAWPARRKQLRELADRARVENFAGHASIRVRFARGHAQEDLWLNVVRSERGAYRSEEFIGELTAPSQLWPHLKPGQRVRIAFYEPLEVGLPVEAR